MPGSAFRYQFDHSMNMNEVEAAFVLAIFATESLHGESDTRLLAEHAMDLDKRACVVDAGTDVGRDLNRLFVGFLKREFGDEAFTVRRIEMTTSENRPSSVTSETAL